MKDDYCCCWSRLSDNDDDGEFTLYTSSTDGHRSLLHRYKNSLGKNMDPDRVSTTTDCAEHRAATDDPELPFAAAMTRAGYPPHASHFV